MAKVLHRYGVWSDTLEILEHEHPSFNWRAILRYLRSSDPDEVISDDPEFEGMRSNFGMQMTTLLTTCGLYCREHFIASHIDTCSLNWQDDEQVQKLFFGRKIRGSVDSFPIAARHGKYNGHYKERILKAVAFTRHDGIVPFVSATAMGTQHDHTLVNELLQRGDRPAKELAWLLDNYTWLGDNHFMRKNIINPPTKPKFEKCRDLRHLVRTGRVFDMVAYIRSRIEHVFSDSRFGKWHRFDRWRKDSETLTYALYVAFGIMNEDIMTGGESFYHRRIDANRIWDHITPCPQARERYRDVFRKFEEREAAGGDAPAAAPDDDGAPAESPAQVRARKAAEAAARASAAAEAEAKRSAEEAKLKKDRAAELRKARAKAKKEAYEAMLTGTSVGVGASEVRLREIANRRGAKAGKKK